MAKNPEHLERQKRDALRRWKEAEQERDRYRKLATKAQVRAMRARADYEEATCEISRVAYRK